MTQLSADGQLFVTTWAAGLQVQFAGYTAIAGSIVVNRAVAATPPWVVAVDPTAYGCAGNVVSVVNTLGFPVLLFGDVVTLNYVLQPTGGLIVPVAPTTYGKQGGGLGVGVLRRFSRGRRRLKNAARLRVGRCMLRDWNGGM